MITKKTIALKDIPGGDQVLKGITYLRSNKYNTVEAMLVIMFSYRFAFNGLQLPKFPESAIKDINLKLYALIGKQTDIDAHSKYNALMLRMTSFFSAVEKLRLKPCKCFRI